LAGGPGEGLSVEVRNVRPVGSELSPRPLRSAGMGLVGLGERVQLACGSLTAGAHPDGGFTVRADLPWPA
jgi:signal transduction histidine kinase